MSERSHDPEVKPVDFCNKLNELLNERLSGIPLRPREQTLFRSLIEAGGNPARFSEEDYDILHTFIERIERTAAEYELTLREPLVSALGGLKKIMDRENKKRRDLQNLAHGRSALRGHPKYLDLSNDGAIALRAQLQERVEAINAHLRTHGDNVRTRRRTLAMRMEDPSS